MPHNSTNEATTDTTERFWVVELDDDDPGFGLFGTDTVGVVDESADGIVSYAHASHAAKIIDALQTAATR